MSEESKAVSLLPVTLEGTERPSARMPAFHKITRLKSRPQTSVLCHGLPDAVWDVEGQLCSRLLQSPVQFWGPFCLTIPTLSICLCLCPDWYAPGVLSWYPTHTVSVLWPSSSDCINSDYGRITLVCLAIKYAHVWLFRGRQPSSHRLQSQSDPILQSSTNFSVCGYIFLSERNVSRCNEISLCTHASWKPQHNSNNIEGFFWSVWLRW